jgi:hypothetical protein
MSSIIELMTVGEFRDLQVGEEGQSFGIRLDRRRREIPRQEIKF